MFLRSLSHANGILTRHLQEITVFKLDFPSDSSDVKFRAVQWICTEILLALAALLNFMPRMYT